MLPALSGWTWARVAPSTPFQCMTTGNEAATSLAFTLNDEPVTVTVSPGLPAELDRLRVARFVHANAAAPAMTVAVTAAPKTTATFFFKFIPTAFVCPDLLVRIFVVEAAQVPTAGLRAGRRSVAPRRSRLIKCRAAGGLASR